jgi:hypothetical protein
MKLGFKTIVLALAVTLLCVPAAFAKNGNGHGKPSWAGGGGDHGKPAWAGHGKGHADNLKAKHEKKTKHEQAGAEDAAEDEELNLDDLNPAWYCKTLEAMMDAADADAVAGGAEAGEFSSFDTEFGTNDKRNSHGKCVSRRAHGEDLAGALDEASAEPTCEPAAPADDEGVADEGAADEGAADDEAQEESEDTEEPAADETSDDEQGEEADDSADEQSDDPEACESDDASDDEASDDQDGDAETAAFARALVSFITL